MIILLTGCNYSEETPAENIEYSYNVDNSTFSLILLERGQNHIGVDIDDNCIVILEYEADFYSSLDTNLNIKKFSISNGTIHLEIEPSYTYDGYISIYIGTRDYLSMETSCN